MHKACSPKKTGLFTQRTMRRMSICPVRAYHNILDKELFHVHNEQGREIRLCSVMSDRSRRMRAEMTVGIDLKKLEDLRIFNGYDTIELDRKHSIETTPASSPDQPCCHDDGDSDYTPLKHTGTKAKCNGLKQRCGRPANPIPRHKRESHIKAEYKRRDKIQKGFDSLMSLVPALSDSSASKESKSSMLFKTAEYCRRLKSEHGNVQSEMTALRQELESLGSQIHELQDKLPKQGASVVDKETLQMDALYDEYVTEETKKNWKFWIFGFFLKPLYKSYRTAVTGTHNSLELSKAVIDWVKEALSLASLRKGFIESLRKLSTRTEIMTNPDQLPQEAASKLCMHCVLTEPALNDLDQEVVYRVTPTALTYTPRTTPKTTPKETPRVTPVPTPTPTPPRTPTSTRRNKRRESHLSKESRSRSNSPQDEGSRLKRRPSHRSEKRHYSGDAEDNSPLMYQNTISQFTFTQPTGLPAKRVSPVPVDHHNSHVDEVSTTMVNRDMKNASPINGYTKAPFLMMPQSTKADEKLATTFIGTLTSFLQATQVNCQIPLHTQTDKSSTVFTCVDAIMSIDHQQPLLNDTHMESAMESTNDSNHAVFMPIERSGLITNNCVLSSDPLSLDTTSDSLMSELSPLSYDSYSSISNDSISVLGTAHQPFTQTTASSHLDSIIPSLASNIAGDTVVKPEVQQMITCEDDSLMKMLTLDVMDMNSLMNFLGNDHHQVQTKLEKSSS